MTPFILLFLGLLLVLIEFYVPGGVIGIIGGLVILASIVFFAMQTESPLWIVVYVIAVGVAVGFLIKFALWRIQSAKPGRSIYLSGDQEGYQASEFDKTIIGKKGVVATDLKPAGHILVEGKRLQAISQSGYLAKGAEVIVVGGEEASLFVKQVKKENPS